MIEKVEDELGKILDFRSNILSYSYSVNNVYRPIRLCTYHTDQR